MSTPFSIASKILLVTGIVALSSAALAQDRQFSTLEERMTGEEYQETGLYKLDEDELAALNRWIRKRSLAEEEIERDRAETARVEDASEDRRGLPDQDDPSPIHSRMVGEYDGLSGYSEIELENGMVWRQTDGRRYDFPKTLKDPEVEIKPGVFGSWQLQVKGYNRRVGVERVE